MITVRGSVRVCPVLFPLLMVGLHVMPSMEFFLYLVWDRRDRVFRLLQSSVADGLTILQLTVAILSEAWFMTVLFVFIIFMDSRL